MVRFLSLLVLLSLALPVHAAVQCDGADDVVTGAALSTYVTAAEKTMLVWYTAEGTAPVGASFCHDTEAQGIVVNSGSSVRAHILRKDVDEVCVAHHDGAQDTVSVAYTDLTTTHLALVTTGGNLLMYKDGAVVSSTASGDTLSLTQTLGICGGGTLNAFAQGRVDVVALYAVALSAGEIAAIAGSRSSRLVKTQPTGLWRFDSCADGVTGNAVTFRDHLGLANTLTGSYGANLSGLTCRGSTKLAVWKGGVQ